MESGNPFLSPLATVIAVIVIRADDGDVLWTENLGNPSGQRCFSRSTIAYYAKQNRMTGHHISRI
jgi:hypothetical protein